MSVDWEANVPEDAKIVASTDQISGDLSGEVVVLNLKNGTYYGLQDVGNRVWELLQQPTTLLKVQSAIADEYDVALDVARQDVQELVDSLASEGLVEVSG